MTTPPDVLRRLRNESRRPRVPRANLVLMTVSLVTIGVVSGLVLTHPRSPALAAYGRLLSPRGWRILEAVSFLFLFAMTAIARTQRRNRT
jgi:hypothetical protein